MNFVQWTLLMLMLWAVSGYLGYQVVHYFFY